MVMNYSITGKILQPPCVQSNTSNMTHIQNVWNIMWLVVYFVLSMGDVCTC